MEPVPSVWEKYRLPYKTLPEINYAEIDTTINWLGKKLKQPLLISSMTGGVALAKTINHNAARVAEAAGVALGLGSMRILLKDKDLIETFKVRKLCPSVPLLANLGAVQLNYGVTADDINYLIDAVEADAIFLHLNALQEAIQPEGDTNFAGLFKKLELVIPKLERPVIVKEVGHGIDKATMKKLLTLPLGGIDVAGVGGTSWAWVEGYRRDDNLGEHFKAVGYPTDECLGFAKDLERPNPMNIIASGGIRSGADGAKSLMLGADLYAAAKPFLESAIDSPEALTTKLKNWQQELQTAMFAVGARNLSELKTIPLAIKE